jgi:gliding motility-associated-like protein
MRLKPLVVIILLFAAISLPAQIIKTVVGSTCGYGGDGGLATSAQIIGDYYCYPTFDNAGNMYFAEQAINTIRKVDKLTGIITTIAGTYNVYGYAGDGGPAMSALLYHPASLAVDDAGNIFIADQVGTVIRMINPAGIITTISGPYATSCIVGDGGPLSGAQFEAISGLTTDHNGNLYITDFGCNVVRKVNSAGIINTVAGNGSYGFSGDGGPATAAQMAYPCLVAVDNAGNIFIPDAQNHRIRRVDAVTGIITTVAGTGISGYTGDGGPATAAETSFPGSVVVDNAGNFYFGDYNLVIRKVDPSGIITTYAGNGIAGYTGDGGPAQNAEINLTEGRINADNNGNIYFINYTNCVIREIPACTNPLSINHNPVHTQICNSGMAVFSVAAVNATGFAWQVNNGTGWMPLADDAVYSGTNGSQLTITVTNTSLNGYLFRCAASNSCATLNTAPDTLTIATPAPPLVSIVADFNPVCTGAAVSFTATPTRGGNTPQYQWMKNGIPVGGNSPFYSDNSLSNNDQVSCVLTSNNSCVTTTQATSNMITINVNPALQATINIQPAAVDICQGSIVSFTSAVTNAGNSPSYQWIKNGVTVGSNAAAYSDASLNNGDQISCLLIGNYGCPLSPFSTSNTVSVTVHPLISPSVSISGPTQICPGFPAVFHAIAVNAPTVHYQWIKDGLAAGTDSMNLQDNLVKSGDTYSCTITATGICLNNPFASSNTIQLKLLKTPLVSLDQNPLLCVNSNRLLDAGNFVSYLWNDGSMARTRLVKDTGEYRVTVTDINGCTASDSVNINAYAQLPAKFLSAADTSICPYGSLNIQAKSGYRNYLWSDQSTGQSITVKQPGVYYLEVTDQNNCMGTDSILVNSKKCALGFHIPSAFTPNHDGRNDLFRPLLYGDITTYKFLIYNRWGQVVFESADPAKGWDGSFNGLPQDTNTFVWTCRYQLSGEQPTTETGTVVLVR